MVKETGKILVVQGAVLDGEWCRMIRFEGWKPRSREALGVSLEVS